MAGTEQKEVGVRNENFTNETNNRNTFRFNKAIGFFGKKPVRQQTDMPGDQALKNYGLIGAGVAHYAGRVTSAGASTALFPSGWSVVKNSSGDYTVTHNLNDSTYGLQLTLNVAGSAGIIYSVTNDANTFRVLCRSLAGALTDYGFAFILSKNI